MSTLASGLALAVWTWAVSAYGGDPVVAHLYDGDLRAAIEAARVVAEGAPDDVGAQEMHIDLLLASGQVGRAVAFAGERLKSQPTNPDAHYLLGRARVDGEAAAEAYERALRLDPDHARSHMGMGAVHTAAGRFADAEAAYGEALRRDGTLGEAWLGLVRLQVLAGRRDRALDLASRGWAAAPDEPGLALVLAQLAPDRARAVLEQASATGDARVFARLAELQLASGDADGATVTARRALVIDPGQEDAARTLEFGRAIAAGKLDLKGLAELLDLRDQVEVDAAAAAAGLERLVARYPDCALAFLALAEAWDRVGNRPKVLEYLALALQRDPTLVDAQAAFGLALLRDGRHAEAVPWLGKAVSVKPWDPDLVRALGQAQLRSGDATSAVATLKRAHETRPWDVGTRLSYAEALQTAGNLEGAYAVVRDGLKLAPDPALAAAFVIVAKQAGHAAVAADFLEDLGRKSGSDALVQLAARVRASP